MKFLFVFPLLLAVIFCLHQLVAGAQISSVYTKNVIFKFYDEVGEEYHSNTIRTHEEFQEDVRNNRENVAVIVHGWRESCSEEWVKMLVHNLQEFRGGSIICMDYSYFAQEENYFRLVRHFDALAEVLALKLKDLEGVGYDPDNMYLFGFSFGGQLVVESGKRFGVRRIKNVDTCDMAGPGFDNKPTTDHRLAGQNVQCIHTSREYGTKFSMCNQDWKMGNCGVTQDAASKPPNGSHGLCPYFYNLAFRHPFYAVPKPRKCRAKNEASRWPKKFRMGYLGENKELVQGELFAMTSKTFPFNVLPKNQKTSPRRTTRNKEKKKTSGGIQSRDELSYSQFANSFDPQHDEFITGFAGGNEDEGGYRGKGGGEGRNEPYLFI